MYVGMIYDFFLDMGLGKWMLLVCYMCWGKQVSIWKVYCGMGYVECYLLCDSCFVYWVLD